MKKAHFLALIISLFAAFSSKEIQAQIQIGSDIDGRRLSDQAGWSVSMPDVNTLAVGSSGYYADTGRVQVYRWNGNAWQPKGSVIIGEAGGDQSGYSVSMPDSNTIAIGAINNYNSTNFSGHVRIYRWDGSSWIQKGGDIDGEAPNDKSGYSVSMPDSNTVAIGAKDNGNWAGHVRVYRWNGSSWIQKGNDVNGEVPGDESGCSVSMPDSNTLAVGARFNDGNGTDAGHVRIYRWNGSSWIQKGGDIDGEAAGNNSGCSVSMPDSNTVAIGAIANVSNGYSRGHVRIYRWNGSAWQQKGGDIDGEGKGGASGYSVSMPDFNTVAIGAPGNDDNGTDAGQVRVYRWNGSSWAQKGANINGEAANNFSGYSVSMPDTNIVAIGAYANDGVAVNAGHVRVYALCEPSASSISPTVCDSYVSPSKKYTWTISGTYSDTLTGSSGCDSIIAINLTINKTTTSSISPRSCDSYVSPSKKYTWTVSGTYADTLTNSSGCDSIIAINLTINKSTTSSISPAVCDSYVSPSKKYTWTVSGTYADTLTNSSGCDSIIAINLTINKSTGSSISPTVCGSYVSPSKKYTWTVSGTYSDTLTNSSGCDSIVTINLIINHVDVSVNQSGNTLTALAANSGYQWLDCHRNFAVISGETRQQFIAVNNGDYAVRITQNNCTDTSVCYTVISSGINHKPDFKYQIYPNPSKGIFTVEVSEDSKMKVYNGIGKLVYERENISQTSQHDLSKMVKGIYYIQLSNNKGIITKNILIE
jgi:hypothetical protein